MENIFEIEKLNAIQKNFVCYCLDLRARYKIEEDEDEDEDEALRYFYLKSKVENNYFIDDVELILIVEAICLRGCNTVDDVKKRIGIEFFYENTSFDDADRLGGITDGVIKQEVALMYLNLHKMLSKFMAESLIKLYE